MELIAGNQTIIQESVLDVVLPEQPNIIITSPPYNVDIQYGSHEDTMPYDEYLSWSEDWMRKCFDMAADNARFILNVPLDTNKDGFTPIGADLTKVAQAAGWKYKSTIIWNEQNISSRTAWGSWMSATAPNVISPVELIIVFYKGEWKREGGTSDIIAGEFTDWTLGVWSFNGENSVPDHPAPFPHELPRRCLHMFSFVEDIVYDPFLGSGTTLAVCEALGRKGYGTEIFPDYAKLAQNRILTSWQKPLAKWKEERLIHAEITEKKQELRKLQKEITEINRLDKEIAAAKKEKKKCDPNNSYFNDLFN